MPLVWFGIDRHAERGPVVQRLLAEVCREPAEAARAGPVMCDRCEPPVAMKPLPVTGSLCCWVCGRFAPQGR